MSKLRLLPASGQQSQCLVAYVAHISRNKRCSSLLALVTTRETLPELAKHTLAYQVSSTLYLTGLLGYCRCRFVIASTCGRAKAQGSRANHRVGTPTHCGRADDCIVLNNNPIQTRSRLDGTTYNSTVLVLGGDVCKYQGRRKDSWPFAGKVALFSSAARAAL